MTTTACTTGEPGGQAIQVHEGPRLLNELSRGPTLVAHRHSFGRPPRQSLDELLTMLEHADIRGRGGAGFPFATKLKTAADASGAPTVVVNVSEGEPASSKDAALAMARPHLILDGASVVAHALRARTVHVVVPSELPAVGHSVQRAIDERSRGSITDSRLRWLVHQADPRFVAGQARAVLELLAGRENLPVTSWQPEAVKGHRGRPTLLSNAETFAQVAVVAALGSTRYREYGTTSEPGTTLLTLHDLASRTNVIEVAHGTPWAEVLDGETLARPILVGGYHGTWARTGQLASLPIARTVMAKHGLALGAGVVLPLPPGHCPVERTGRITEYLARQSARRCGPCLNGLPALAGAVWQINEGGSTTGRVEELARLVFRRGACAHPDGTVRMVHSMMQAYGDEVHAHAEGYCRFAQAVPTTRAHQVLDEVSR